MADTKYQEKLVPADTKLFLTNDNVKDKSMEAFFGNDYHKHPPHSKYVALVHKKAIRKPLISTLDTTLCLLLLAPCVVGFWRGTWRLLDIYDRYLPAWLCVAWGVFIHLVFVIVQDNLNHFVEPKSPSRKVKFMKIILTRLYSYVFAVSAVMTWRGGWLVIDTYFHIHENEAQIVQKENTGTYFVVSACALVCITLLRSLRNCISPPFVFCTDDAKKIFIVPTRFRVEMSERKSLYVLDCLFSVIVIGTLVVFVWRGGWALIDVYLFPENQLWSAWGSLIVGYSTVAIAFMLQPFMRWLCDRITGVSRVLAADLFLILSLVGTINVWRGIWNLLNLYLLPDNLELSCWITHWVCLTVLILLGCSNSLIVRGVYIDAEEPAGKCVVFPCYYLRLIFQEHKLKKLQREQSKTEMADAKPYENNHVINVPNSETMNVNHSEGDAL